MSDEITTAMVDTFNDGIEALAQQMESKLLARVRQESQIGERVAFDQVGVVSVKERTVRHADTQYINTPHRKRWVTMTDYDIADLRDLPDLVKILNDPVGEYARAFIAAFNRQQDATIIAAALGTSLTGKTGLTQVTLPSAQQIAAGGTGFTLAKVRQAMRILKAGSAVDEQDVRVTIAWTSAQEEEFLDTTEVKSIDFNTQRVLVDGGMGDGRFYGFEYVRLEDWTDEEGALHQIIPKTGTVRSCVAWVQDGVLMNRPRIPRVRTDPMPNKRYSWQVFADGTFGATRMQEPKVVQMDVEEP